MVTLTWAHTRVSLNASVLVRIKSSVTSGSCAGDGLGEMTGCILVGLGVTVGDIVDVLADPLEEGLGEGVNVVKGKTEAEAVAVATIIVGDSSTARVVLTVIRSGCPPAKYQTIIRE